MDFRRKEKNGFGSVLLQEDGGDQISLGRGSYRAPYGADEIGQKDYP